MKKCQILKLAEFMYSADNSNDVPFRICLEMGMSGEDLSKEQFVMLLEFLSTTDCTKESFNSFLSKIGA